MNRPIKRERGRPKRLVAEYEYRDGLLLALTYRRPITRPRRYRPCIDLPQEIWKPEPVSAELAELLSEKPSLSEICRWIIEDGGVEWIDRRTERVLAEITNWKTLRTRMIEAREWANRPIKVTSTSSTGSNCILNFIYPIVISLTVASSMTTIRRQRKTILRVGRKLHK
jgi:hypothetical protein